MIALVEKLKEAERGEVSSDTEENVSGKPGVEVSNDWEFEEVAVLFVRSPRLEANVAIRHDEVEGKDFDGCYASETVEVASRELFRF